MKKYIKTLVLVGVLTSTKLFAQQDPMFSQYWVNAQVLSPTQAGADGRTLINATGRHQWMNVDGAPKTYSLSVGGKLTEKIGLGFSYINDRIGISQTNTLNADVNYHLNLNKKWKLISGIRLSGLVNNLNLTEISTVTQGDPMFAQNLSSGLKPNAGFGFLLTTDKFYAGYSQPRVMNYDFGSSASINTKIIAHRFIYAGYNFDVTNTYKLRPSILVKEVANAPIQMDINVANEFNEKLVLGASVRTREGIGAMVGFLNFHKLDIYYCYDYPLTAISLLSKQTHQLTLVLNLTKKSLRVNSPRYFN